MATLDPKTLQIYRSLDKADRMEPIDVFNLLTKGRSDESGAFTPGCGITNGQAFVLSSFVCSTKHPLIWNRMTLMRKLEESIADEASGRTAWDVLLDMYEALPEPKNIAWILDDLAERLSARSAGGRTR